MPLLLTFLFIITIGGSSVFKVGIFVPYARNETTLAATQFADWLVRSGIQVVMLSPSKPGKGVHTHWDSRVIYRKPSHNENKTKLFEWAFNCTHICWFEPDEWAFRMSKIVCADSRHKFTKHYFFPSRCTAKEDSKKIKEFLDLVDEVICLNRSMLHWLNSFHPSHSLSAPRSMINICSPSTPVQSRYGPKTSGKVKLLVVVTKSAIYDVGIGLLDVFDYLLLSHENLEITVLLQTSWPSYFRQKLSAIAKLHGERLSVVTSPDYYDYPKYTFENDWVYLCSTRHDYGSLISVLAGTGTPLICHTLPPVLDILGGLLTNGQACKLIDTGVFDTNTCPIADVDVDDVGNRLDEIVGSPSVILQQSQIESFMQQRKSARLFDRFIDTNFISTESKA